MRQEIICAILLSLSPLCLAQGPLPIDNDAHALCARILTSHIGAWKRQVRGNLHKIAAYPLYAVHVETAPALVGAALNIRPSELNELKQHPLKISLDGDRLQLELQQWPRLQRSLISLKKPEVIKDFSLAQSLSEPDQDQFLATTVQAATRLFYPIRELSHETQLGLVMPLREVYDQGPGETPFFEFQIALLKSCVHNSKDDELLFTGEAGESLCLDSLVEFSTWPETIVELEYREP